jgi:hypothetical protein
MASTAVFSHHSPQEIYEHINTQFQLSNAQLLDLAKTFLHEFKLGLESYGHDMAMMYATLTPPIYISKIGIDLLSSLVFPTGRRKGTHPLHGILGPG